MSTGVRMSSEHANGYWEDDGFQPTTHQSLSHAVHARKSEYTRPNKIKIKVGTWNVAACSGVDKDVGAWFVDGKGIDKRLAGLDIANAIDKNGSQEHIESVDDQEARRSRSIMKKSSTVPEHEEGVIPGGKDIGLYVLGLQEVVELSAAKEYIGKLYSDNGPITKWKKALQDALPKGYTMVSEQQLSGLVLLIYASPEIVPTISSVSSVSVGTGVMGYLGNKGGVVTRVVLGETTRLVFVNSHLASGTDATHLDRRCWDVSQILARTKFDPISRGGVLDDHIEGIGDEDFAFWFGDLNFRLIGLPGEDIRRLLMLHTRGEYGQGSKSAKKMDRELSRYEGSLSTIESYDSSTSRATSNETADSSLPDPDDFDDDDEPRNPHEDPTSLQATIDSLLPHDQLGQVRKARKAFHDGWREGPVTFLPTYRYDVGSMGMFDTSEKKRTPSWCDRILFRTRRDKIEYDGKTQEQDLARIKDEEMKARGMDKASEDEDILYEYDPESDGAEADESYGKTEGQAYVENDYDEYQDDERAPPEVVTFEGYIDKIQLDTYTSHQRVLSSDHKPVDAVFTLTYDAVVPELKSKIQQEVARELDRAENEGRPNITVVVDHSQGADDIAIPYGNPASNQSQAMEGHEGVYFGKISYLEWKRRGITIANIGQSTATFAFMNKQSTTGQSESIAPDWLDIRLVTSEDGDPQRATTLDKEITLEPGDAINVSLSMCISDMLQVRSLNSGAMKLDDVLVLRVTDGRDHFIPIRASWLASCFGNSIDQLIRVPEGGVRALASRDQAIGDSGLINPSESVRWSAPRELFKLTEATEILTERALAEKDMVPPESALLIDTVGWPFDQSTWTITESITRDSYKQTLLAALDTDKPLLECFPAEVTALQKLEIVAETLVKFLASLSDGIITAELWSKLDREFEERRKNGTSMSSEAEKSEILEVLSSSPNHNISLVFLTAMLGKVASDVAPVTPAAINAASGLSGISSVSSGRMSLDQTLRRSLSFKSGKTVTAEDQRRDSGMKKRQDVDRKFAEIFGPVVCRGTEMLDGRARKTGEERQRRIVEVFLEGLMEQSVA